MVAGYAILQTWGFVSLTSGQVTTQGVFEMNMEEAIQWLLKKQGSGAVAVTDDSMGKTNKKAIKASIDEDIRRWRERTEKQRLEEVRKQARATELAKIAEDSAKAERAKALTNPFSVSGAIVPLKAWDTGNWTVPQPVQRSVLLSEQEYESMKQKLKQLEGLDSERIGEESMKSMEHKFTSTRKFKFKGG